MYRNIFAALLLSLLTTTGTYVHAQDYIVERAPFSSRIDDEFSPVYFRGGIVFCSNMRDNSLAGFRDEQSRLFKIFYIKGKERNAWGVPELLSKELTSGYNDGPASFNRSETKMYYSRNNSIIRSLGNISDPFNKLGIYSADYIDGTWKNVTPFEYNDPEFSLSSPSLSPEEDRIYFSSDMPGGLGGMDIYYSENISGTWQKPVNLGPTINTSGNETFPFACPYKKLYFSSDGHGGFGGKDLYYTQETEGRWIPPVHLDSAINSPYDDFGIVLDSTYENGFFSSKRYKTDDIFSFRIAPLEFTDCDSIRENNYCFTFYDEKYTEIDTIPVTYVWDFGEGEQYAGPEVRHCFNGPGKYDVRLIVIDQLTGDTISERATYFVDLPDIEQVYIASDNIALVNGVMNFEAENLLKGYNITDYLWDFGKGFQPGGYVMEKSFSRDGEYTVRLGLSGIRNETEIKKCYTKKVRIFNSFRELQDVPKATSYKGIDAPDLHNLTARIFFMDDLSERQRSRIRVTTDFRDGTAVSFDRTGIISSSTGLLYGILRALKDDQNLRVQVKVHQNENPDPRLSERWAQEISFWFRNMGMERNEVKCKSYNNYNSVFRPGEKGTKNTDGVIEFIFMEK